MRSQESPDSYTTPLLVGSGTSAADRDHRRRHRHGTRPRRPARSSGAPTGSTPPTIQCTASSRPRFSLAASSSRRRATGRCWRSSLAARGDVTTSHKAWSFDLGPDVPTPISDGKLLYVVRDNGVVHALDVKTGAIVWGPERLKTGAYSSSPVLVDGKLYVTSENEGLTSVFTAGPEVRSPCREPARRLLPRITRRVERPDLHPDRQVPLGDRQGQHQYCELTLVRSGGLRPPEPPYTLARGPLRRRAPFAWLTRCARSRCLFMRSLPG